MNTTHQRILWPGAFMLWIEVQMSVIVGLVIALFMFCLDFVTHTFQHNPVLIWGLPFAGLLIFYAYKFADNQIVKGNAAIFKAVNCPEDGIPNSMTIYIFFATLITHLFGGSAGREGTAVQIGGSIASAFSTLYRKIAIDRSMLLIAGIAAGFGSVFGTPFAGAIFAIEVTGGFKIKWPYLPHALLAAYTAHYIVLLLGVKHTQYTVPAPLNLPLFGVCFPQEWSTWLSILAIGLIMGLVAQCYIRGMEAIKMVQSRFKISQSIWLPILGGGLIIAATYAIGDFDYNGLGTTNYGRNTVSITQSFLPVSIPKWSWLIKLLLTMVTLSFGYKGGEVTPLFFVGATLGHILAVYFQLPVALIAGVGLISVFGAAAKAPLTTIFLGWALFGGGYLVFYILVAFTSNWASGKKSIYD